MLDTTPSRRARLALPGALLSEENGRAGAWFASCAHVAGPPEPPLANCAHVAGPSTARPARCAQLAGAEGSGLAKSEQLAGRSAALLATCAQLVILDLGCWRGVEYRGLG
ncbi:hypothetical protein GCM10009682_36230 [Luedemannella flava]|uniref:Uncharacterized protein n=1 Tax=Luedemannella flava TaxID=349316 RepID=A0ABP4YCX4_9ACTN